MDAQHRSLIRNTSKLNRKKKVFTTAAHSVSSANKHLKKHRSNYTTWWSWQEKKKNILSLLYNRAIRDRLDNRSTYPHHFPDTASTKPETKPGHLMRPLDTWARSPPLTWLSEKPRPTCAQAQPDAATAYPGKGGRERSRGEAVYKKLREEDRIKRRERRREKEKERGQRNIREWRERTEGLNEDKEARRRE